MPVYNVEPYLRECLDSVLAQSIGLDRLELIAVDDGSTDGCAEILDVYADRHPQMQVFHEPNSGGPGRPRNVGLDHAAGTYVFFLDADDYLGHEALERLVDMAERNSSDIVLGKMIGVSGRTAPKRAFLRTRNRAKLTDVYLLNVFKLFRRALIERLGVRFDETVAGGEDGPFTAELLLSADVVSVVADYRCYYYRDRPTSQTKRVRTEDPADHVVRLARRAQLLAERRPPGKDRDLLMSRHVKDMMRPFGALWVTLPPERRRRAFDIGRALLHQWSSPAIEAMLAPPDALRAYCLRHGLIGALEDIIRALMEPVPAQPIVEGRRVFANFPHFRDTCGIPDRCFELTDRIRLHSRVEQAELSDGRLRLSGKARLSYLGGETTVVLKRWPAGEEHRYATRPTPTVAAHERHPGDPHPGFSTEIDLMAASGGSPLPPGPWQVRLAVGPRALRHEVPIVIPRRKRRALPTVLGAPPGSAVQTRLYRATDGSLRLRIGPDTSLRTPLELTQARTDLIIRRGRRRLRRGMRRLRRAVRRLRRRVGRLRRRVRRLLTRVGKSLSAGATTRAGGWAASDRYPGG